MFVRALSITGESGRSQPANGTCGEFVACLCAALHKNAPPWAMSAYTPHSGALKGSRRCGLVCHWVGGGTFEVSKVQSRPTACGYRLLASAPATAYVTPRSPP